MIAGSFYGVGKQLFTFSRDPLYVTLINWPSSLSGHNTEQCPRYDSTMLKYRDIALTSPPLRFASHLEINTPQW